MVVCGNLDREIHKDRGWWVQGLQRSHGKTCCWRQRIFLHRQGIWLGIYPYEERWRL